MTEIQKRKASPRYMQLRDAILDAAKHITEHDDYLQKLLAGDIGDSHNKQSPEEIEAMAELDRLSEGEDIAVTTVVVLVTKIVDSIEAASDSLGEETYRLAAHPAIAD